MSEDRQLVDKSDRLSQSMRLLMRDRLPYAQALALMRDLADKVSQGEPGALILCEHEPLLSLGRRADAANILVSGQTLEERGIAVHRVERGGQVTYHGPGQVMAYPVLCLKDLGFGVRELVWRLEEALLHVLSDCGIRGERRQGYPGVWVKGDKIASIGLAIKSGVTLHGLALNNNPNLGNFKLITPCGLQGVRMTSLEEQLGRPVESKRLYALLVRHLCESLGLTLLQSPSV